MPVVDGFSTGRFVMIRSHRLFCQDVSLGPLYCSLCELSWIECMLCGEFRF